MAAITVALLPAVTGCGAEDASPTEPLPSLDTADATPSDDTDGPVPTDEPNGTPEATDSAERPDTTEAPTSIAPPAGLPPGRDVVVTSITDGDTFRAGDERIRIIGIDTPETAQGPECFGEEATAALTALIPVGTEVRLVSDVEPLDRYDRTLAYVHRLSDGIDVGLALLIDGAAEAVVYEPNVARSTDYADADSEAWAAGAGQWSACPASGGTTTTPGTAPSAADPTGCDPSYPDVCIPPSPPDLDCGDIPHRRFRVLAPDPHRFDGGGDGIGCESG